MTKKQKTCAEIVFAVCLVWLAWLVLFKLWLPGDGFFPACPFRRTHSLCPA